MSRRTFQLEIRAVVHIKCDESVDSGIYGSIIYYS